MTRIARSPDCGNSPKNQRALEIALALMGQESIEPDTFVEGASWEHPDGAIVGRAAIVARLAALAPYDWIELSEVVTHGKAGSVSGRFQRPEENPKLFCHVIRFTSASARQIAQIVSFDHAG
ncbi:hypothetical protein [Maritimibacter sp. DP1N21-5]|uniref:hypothetical protein n=1 Tax=Maritimibacter sp. DP1N21-5 TaxID=2836867 RepID=UPI001C4649AD|nr:hypothetical protein [Maritimibacter sp. DP1N21-5]MBV7409123.1 hypothetical protein [Maritimibacter sp. DP1N21-5]